MKNIKKNILFEPVFFGTDIETVARAKTYSVAMNRFFGVTPIMDVQEKYVRLFYKGDDLKKAQIAYAKMIEPGSESDIKIDYMPIFMNPTLKRYKVPLLVVTAILVYLVAK